MKKKLLMGWLCHPDCARQIKRTMRLTLIAVFLFCMQLSAKVYSQRDIKVSFKDIRLSRALDKIEQASGCRFFYNSKQIPLNTMVSFSTKGSESLTSVLTSLLGSVNLKYQFLSNEVIALKVPGEVDLLMIKGIVKDKNGMPLPGVSIKVKGENKSAATDTDGKFQIGAAENSVLIVSYIGFQTREIIVKGRSDLDIVLEESTEGLNEVIVVGYGTQKRTSVTAAVSTLKGDDMVKAPVANISNSLIGRVAGIISKQSGGEPGADANDIKIRGISTTGKNSGPLIVVDGIQRSFDQLNPNEVESITVLKDAAAVAPYGLAGANGVILVTSKRGKTGQTSFNYDGWYGFQQPTQYPKYLDAYGYAKLLNEANKNIGSPATYTDEQLQKFKDGSDPDHYPNTDWVKKVLDFHAPMTNHNLSFSGGTDKIRYYSSIGYLYQQGVVDVINMKRYNLAANIDADVTPTTTVSIDIKGNLQKNTQPGGATGTSIFTDVTKTPPIYPYQFSNGLPGSTTYPQIYQSGYNNKDNNIFYSQLSVQQKLAFIPGLSIKGVFAFDKNYSVGKKWVLPVTYYNLNAKDEFVPLVAGPPTPTLEQTFKQGQVETLQGFINYKNSFGKHNVELLGVYETRKGEGLNFSASRIGYAVFLDELALGSTDKANFDNTGSSNKNAQTGLVYRAGYNYDNKYLLELGGRYDGHYYFAPDKRFTFFPALSLGWLLSEESFIRDNFSWIDNLKLRGSYGKSGNLAGDPFQYLSSYGLRPGAVFGGTNPYQTQGVFERLEPNVNITWETAWKTDVGMEATLWHGKLGVELDFFRERRSDMLISPNAAVPGEYGIGIAQENAGIMENHGIDLTLSTQHAFSKDLHLNASFNVSYAKNKLVQTFENSTTLNNPNRSTTGKPYQTQFGYQSIGLFQSQDEVDHSPKQFGPVFPGDIKYRDVNGDNIIDPNDQVVIGNPAFPGLIYGLNTSLTWKNLDMSMLWQGAGQVNFNLVDDAAYPFFNGAKVQDIHLDYWTPDNRDASNPRLTPSPSVNNTQVSSFWMRDASYLRLKTLEVGYSMPKSVIKTLRIHSLRVFGSGQNLLTLSKIKNFDPEVSDNKGRYYFQQRVFSFGLNVKF